LVSVGEAKSLNHEILQSLWLLQNDKKGRTLTSSAGVDGAVAIGGGGDADGAFLRGGVHGLQKNLKPMFLVLLGHFREAGLIRGEPFFPSFFFQIILSGHLGFLIHPHPTLSHQVRWEQED